MNPWWPCTETKEEKALSRSLVHAPTHTDTQPSRDQEMDKRKTRNRTGAGRGRWGHRTASPGKEGCTEGRRRNGHVGRRFHDPGGSEVHRRGGRILRHRGAKVGWENGMTGPCFLEGLTVSHPLNFVRMSYGGQSICPWVPREIPGQGSRGVARPSRLAAPSASMHRPPGRPWCLPAPGPRQGSVHGLHQGATVQGSSCGPPAHSGTMERHVGVSWGEMGGLGTEDWGSNSSGQGRGERLWVAPRKVSDPPRP